ncbi:MAG: sigma-54-dependent transcriptional regulator [Myxococcota bacterium]
MSHSVLLVDDEKAFRSIAAAALREEGYEVTVAATKDEAEQAWTREPPELVVLDRKLPDGDGLDLLARFREDMDERNLDTAFIMVTAYADVEHAVEALKRGADDYLTKPVQLPDLLIKLRKAVERSVLQRRVRAFRRGEPDAIDMLERTRSPRMKRVLEMARRVAESPNTSVLIRGESGAGKDLVARYIHALTPARSEAAFVELNCAALTEQLAESELFGHERGAFTDAKQAKRGLLELAHEGTLFLDEVGDLGPGIQAKLLRVLETMRFRRLGGTRDHTVDVRFVSATNRDLESAVEHGELRLDLYHRLNVFHIELPALRERPEDILPLAEGFMQSTAGRLGRPLRRISEEAARALVEYPFPGNVRELKNVIERAVILETKEALTPEALVLRPVFERHAESPATPPFFAVHLNEQGAPPTLREVERAYLSRVLEHTGRNKTRTAKLLGLTFPTVSKKMGEFGL